MHQPCSELLESRRELRQSRPHLMHIQNSYFMHIQHDLWRHTLKGFDVTLLRICNAIEAIRDNWRIRSAIDAIRDNDNIDFKYWPGWV